MGGDDVGRKRGPIPGFRSEAEERAFWESQDTAEHVDRSTARLGRLSNLKEGCAERWRVAEGAVTPALVPGSRGRPHRPVGVAGVAS